MEEFCCGTGRTGRNVTCLIWSDSDTWAAMTLRNKRRLKFSTSCLKMTDRQISGR